MEQVDWTRTKWTSSFLFHKVEYLKLCASTHANVKTFFTEIKKEPLGIQFQVRNTLANSPVSASFGGLINCSTHVIPDEVIAFFTGFELELIQDGVSEVRIRTFPKVYNPTIAEVESVILESLGYVQQVSDIAQFIHIDQSSFQSKVKLSELQKLRRAAREMTFTQLPNEKLHEVYSLINDNRRWKRYPMTSSFEWLAVLLGAFPEDYLLFGVFDQELVAAAVCVRINSEVLYTFYLGDIPRTRAISPVVFLLEGIYNYAGMNSFKLLDLGVSTENGIKNDGLYTFKKNLGTTDTHRITWSKRIQ